MYNHFIRLDGNKIIKGFSTAFEQPAKSDILIAENTQERHFILNDEINPALTDMQGIALYKYDKGKTMARTAAEIEADTIQLPGPAPSNFDKLTTRLGHLETLLVNKAVITAAEKETLLAAATAGVTK